MSITRRQFVKRSSAAAAAVSLPMFVPSAAFGANDKISIGIIGLGGRGSHSHATSLGNQDGVEIVALCDPDKGRLDGAAHGVKRWFKRNADKYTDMLAQTHRYRRGLDRHAGLLARAGDCLGLPGRQARLCRETTFTLYLGRQADAGRGAEAQTHRPARDPASLG